jgi:protein-disulfide isomerase
MMSFTRRDRFAVLVAGIALLASLCSVPDTPAAQSDPPAPERLKVVIGDAPSLGPETAPVTIVEFGDFECLFCARGSRTLRALVDDVYPQKVRWVFKHYPLRNQRAAALVHQAAVAAQDQQQFWPFHKLLYANQGHHGLADLQSYAAALGLDVERFTKRMHELDAVRRVQRDKQQGRALHVSVTPTYFVNGRRVMGAQSVGYFRTLVEEELTAAGIAAIDPPSKPQ